jgi:hypothetical protein
MDFPKKEKQAMRPFDMIENADFSMPAPPVINDDGEVAAFVSTTPLMPGVAAASDIYVRVMP